MSAEVKAISDYSGLTFSEVMDLPFSLYLLYKKDAWVYNNKRSEQGKKFLKDVWRLQQTEPDYDAIHNYQNGGGN